MPLICRNFRRLSAKLGTRNRVSPDALLARPLARAHVSTSPRRSPRYGTGRAAARAALRAKSRMVAAALAPELACARHRRHGTGACVFAFAIGRRIRALPMRKEEPGHVKRWPPARSLRTAGGILG